MDDEKRLYDRARWLSSIVYRPSSLVPDLPGRFAARPELIQVLVLAVRVHREEEAFVAVRHQLPLARQTLKRRAFKKAVAAFEVVEEPSVENEEPRADPPVQLRLLGEARHPAVFADLKDAEARDGAHGRDGREFAVRAVKLDDGAEVNVGDAVAVSHHEGVA